MKTTPALLLALALALAASGCALTPKDNARLEEARAAYAILEAEPGIERLAPIEAKRAEEALERAVLAHASREDPALVDHLAYVARQRAIIAAETARRIAAEQALRGSSLQQASGRRS